MNIWLLQIGEPLPLEPHVRILRTGLLAEKFSERGHTVHWWASTFEHQRKIMLFEKDRDVQLRNGLTLHLLNGGGYRANISLARYIDHFVISKKFRHRAPQYPPPDIILASVPCHRLAFEGMRFARQKNIPFVVDVRDPWPDTFLDHISGKILHWLASQTLKVDFACLRHALQGATALVAMSRGILQWALDKIGRPANQWDRVFFLGYKSAQNSFNNISEENNKIPPWLQGREHLKLLIFFGTFGHSYELQLVVAAARRLLANGRNDLFFVLAGTGEQMAALQREASILPNVFLPGWLTRKEIAVLLRSAYVGLAPIQAVKNAAPNKIFEYFSAGLPIISSLEGEMAELIDQNRLGLNYRPGDLEGLCGCIEKLLDNRALRDEMAANALVFFRNHGDADKIYSEYADHIERLVEARQRGLFSSSSRPFSHEP